MSTNPENLMKIGPIHCEISDSIKSLKRKRKNSRDAQQAGRLGGLNNGGNVQSKLCGGSDVKFREILPT